MPFVSSSFLLLLVRHLLLEAMYLFLVKEECEVLEGLTFVTWPAWLDC